MEIRTIEKIKNISGILLPRSVAVKIINEDISKIEDFLLFFNSLLIDVLCENAKIQESGETPLDGMVLDYDTFIDGEKYSKEEITLINKEITDNGYEVEPFFSEEDLEFLASMEGEPQILEEFKENVTAFLVTW